MSWLYIALLALAVAVVAGAEWPRFGATLGVEARRRREREKRKTSLRVLPGDAESDADEFAASVERDLARLPTVDDRERR